MIWMAFLTATLSKSVTRPTVLVFENPNINGSYRRVMSIVDLLETSFSVKV